jgi:hypothetical protein
MEKFVSTVFYFAVAYKWWIFACIPIVIVLIVLRLANPR